LSVGSYVYQACGFSYSALYAPVVNPSLNFYFWNVSADVTAGDNSITVQCNKCSPSSTCALVSTSSCWGTITLTETFYLALPPITPTPISLKKTPTCDTCLEFMWSPGAGGQNAGFFDANYTIYWSVHSDLSSASSAVVYPGTFTYTITGLTPGATYYVAVQATNDYLQGTVSSTLNEQAGRRPCYVRQIASTQSIPSGSNTLVTGWDTVLADRGGVTYSSGVFTVPTSGVYTVHLGLSWDFGLSGMRMIWIEAAGASTRHGTQVMDNISTMATTVTVELSASDPVSVNVFQPSGSSANLGTISSIFTSVVSICKVD